MIVIFATLISFFLLSFILLGYLSRPRRDSIKNDLGVLLHCQTCKCEIETSESRMNRYPRCLHCGSELFEISG